VNGRTCLDKINQFSEGKYSIDVSAGQITAEYEEKHGHVAAVIEAAAVGLVTEKSSHVHALLGGVHRKVCPFTTFGPPVHTLSGRVHTFAHGSTTALHAFWRATARLCNILFSSSPSPDPDPSLHAASHPHTLTLSQAPILADVALAPSRASCLPSDPFLADTLVLGARGRWTKAYPDLPLRIQCQTCGAPLLLVLVQLLQQ
jgi:hypothetical protein